MGAAEHVGAFPRHEVAELVDAAARARAARERWQGWVLGAALTLVALGLPLGRVLVTAPTLWTAEGGAHPYPLLVPLARWLLGRLGGSPETPWFLLSALGWGLSMPVLLSTARRLGFPRGLALPAALVALLSPAAWIGACLPHTFGLGVLGASLLLDALLARERASALGYATRASAVWCLSVLAEPELAGLLPAVVWACVWRGRGALAARLAPPLAAAALVLLLMSASRAGAWWRAPGVGVAETLAFPLDAGIGLAVAAWGVVALFATRRSSEESSPPPWMLAWCGAFLLHLVPGHPPLEILGTYLVPVAALGIADWLQREPLEERARRWALSLLLAQLLVAAGARSFAVATDPGRAWRELARTHLEPGDVVLSSLVERRYLLRHRFGLAALEPPGRRAEIEALVASGRRVVLDGVPPAQPHGAAAPWVLHAGGLAPAPAPVPAPVPVPVPVPD